MKIEESDGYKKLHDAIMKDERSGRTVDERMRTLHFAIDRAKHYEEKIGISASEMLTAWESRRNYWYMNYYQDANQPKIQGDSVRVFDTVDDLLASIGKEGFRCPHCKGVSKSPYQCDSGMKLPLINSHGKPEVCNWKVFGLFGSLGKGVYVFVKEKVSGENMFMPVAWEMAESNGSVAKLQTCSP